MRLGLSVALTSQRQAAAGFPAAGTPLGDPYCDGFDLVQEQADGSGGTSSVVIESNSATCGYNPTYTFTATDIGGGQGLIEFSCSGGWADASANLNDAGYWGHSFTIGGGAGSVSAVFTALVNGDYYFYISGLAGGTIGPFRLDITSL